MKTYPSITKDIAKEKIYAFDKLDGSNIRVEWSKKNGFHKFGTRKRLLDKNEPILGRSVDLFLNKYSEDLSRIFIENKWTNTISFFEFFGPTSFAGVHNEDEIQDVVLFDVGVEKKGLIEPSLFLKIFKDIQHADLLYYGNPNSEFVDSVKNGTLEGMTLEGVVCKGKYKSPGLPLMFKIKNEAWISKLRDLYKDDKKFQEML
jgi:hypothetical protein